MHKHPTIPRPSSASNPSLRLNVVPIRYIATFSTPSGGVMRQDILSGSEESARLLAQSLEQKNSWRLLSITECPVIKNNGVWYQEPPKTWAESQKARNR